MKTNRASYISTKRDAWVEINLDHIERNINELKQFLKRDSKVLAVVKADAYGHGATMIVQTLIASGIDMLGVASVDEAVQLREVGVNIPLIVLGASPVWAFDTAIDYDITLSIFSDTHIEACRLAFESKRKKVKVHIKIDTGMNRIGVSKDDAVAFVKKVQSSDFIELQGIFSHFANAENLELTQKQYQLFKNVLNEINTSNLLIHISNTAASVSFKDFDYNMARLGIGIYGLLPDFDKTIKEFPNLQQAISLKARITNVHRVREAEGVSYGYSYITRRPIKIATVPVGYADGVSRRLSNKIYGILNGEFVKQIGTITMDQMMFDVSEINAQEGDIITLLGSDGGKFISIDEWANILGTINYELTCLLKVRLSRVYTR